MNLRRVCVLVLLMLATTAHAKKRDWRERINHTVDDGAKAAKATKAQKAQAHAAVGELIAASEEAFGTVPGTAPEQDELLRLFLANKLDVPALDKIRTRRDGRHAKVADGLVHAFVQIHGILEPAQRQLVVAWAQKKVQGKRMKSFQQKLIAGVISAAVELALEQIGATDPERVVARKTRDSLMAAVSAARGDADAETATLSTLFLAESIDKTALEQFRTERVQKIAELTAAFQQALVDLHDGFSPERRTKLATMVRDRTQRKASTPSTEPGEDAFQ